MPRQAGTPIEARGVLARPGADGVDRTVWSSTQAPHWLRDALVVSLDEPAHATVSSLRTSAVVSA